ncbi:F-box/WD repeat-containing protein 4-like isoform X2 [Galleria mellonella]|uniref:F-box/WD repeat-containing protein 4-like isoform X2 n=1 Tax=Galleria mellonella TaxID=7137 RepID=A0ABM3MS32_GALME|nr:F-box/WD repeat-containing protein 4-like isoform X2 [Galleria mellonella]
MTTLLLHLPPEVLANIFRRLTTSELLNVMLSCKFLRNFIINDNAIWRSAGQKKLFVYYSIENSNPITLSWYERSRISYNWRYGVYKAQVLIRHYTNYMPWLLFHNSEALVMSVGSALQCYTTNKKGLPCCKVACWKLQVPKIKRSGVRTNDISRFVLRNNLIVCGNRDGCMAVYEVNNIKQKPQLMCHIRDCHENGEVELTTVELFNKNEPFHIIATGSNYSSVLRLWSLRKHETHEPTPDVIYNNHDISVTDITLSNNVGIRCMHLNQLGNKLAIGLNGNDSPVLLDARSCKVLMTPHEKTDLKQVVRDIQWHDPNTFVYVTHSGKLRLIDIRSHDKVYDAMDPFLSSLYCVKSDGDRSIIVGSSEYARCVLFDTRKNESHVQIYFTQKQTSPVYSLDFDSTKLIAAADRSLAVLDFDVNPANVERQL